MTTRDFLFLSVILVGFFATLAGVVVLTYLLAIDLLSRASESHSHSRPHTDLPVISPTLLEGVRARTSRDSLAGDNTERAFPPGAHGSHDMPAPPRGHLTPITNRGVREVGAGELPHQMWTGRLR